MKRAIMCALLAAAGCGGLDLPTPGATRCSEQVYLEVGVSLTCGEALAAVRLAADATGVDVANGMRIVEFMATETMDRFEHPEAIGLTNDNDVAVSQHYTRILIHEVLHLDDHSHCNWSAKYLPLFNTMAVSGAFTDTCARVRCSSTRSWVADGQYYGDGYVCTPIP